jgi:multiple sugar transport system ATP-binding protein
LKGIVLDSVRKEFPGGVVAVHDLTLEVEPGEFLVLVGPSGCGKSTTLRMVAGLEAVTRGRIHIGGRDVTGLPPRERDVAMVFQNYALYAHMSVRDNIGFGLKMAGMARKEIRRRVGDAAVILGLVDLLDRKPKQLSGGQRQRVAMGRAIVREPSAFLMDEPLSNLDAKLRVEMRGEVVGVQRRIAAPTLYVTHDQVEAMTMGDRVAILRHGVLEQLGTPDEIYDDPAGLFVASFVGSPSMNLFRARLDAGDGRCFASFAECRLLVPEQAFAARRRLGDYLGSEIVLGIRPEDFRAGSNGGLPEEMLVHGVVDRVESLGSEVVAYVKPGGAQPQTRVPLVAETIDTDRQHADARSVATDGATLLTARLDRKVALHSGDHVRIGVDVSRLYFFDPQTGEAIT